MKTKKFSLLILMLGFGLTLAACGEATTTPASSTAKGTTSATSATTVSATTGTTARPATTAASVAANTEAAKQVAAFKELEKELISTEDALKQNKVDAAKTAFKKFDSAWFDVEGTLRLSSRDLYRQVEDLIAKTGRNLLRSDNPDVPEVLAGVTSLRQKYNEATKVVETSKVIAAPKQPPLSGKDVEAATGKVSEFLKGKSDSLVKNTTAFVTTVKSRDIAKSKEAYVVARFDYESVEFLAEAFSDLDIAIDARPDDFEKGENDPKWTGFHPLEKAIYADGKLDARTDQLADQLIKDVITLNDAIKALEIDPAVAIAGAGELIEEIQAGKITGEEERYSRTDLNDFKANFESAKYVFEAYSPFLKQRNAALDDDVRTRFAEVEKSIAGFFPGGKAVEYTKVDDATRKSIAQKVESLADAFSSVAGTLGLKI